MQDLGRYTADGYSFYTRRDAMLAEQEAQKVKYLEGRLDYKKPKNVLQIYNKMIDEHMFKTPVGHFFLKKIQQYLLGTEGISPDDVRDIPLYVTYDGEFREQAHPARSRVKPAEPPKPQKTSKYTFSILLNIVLVIAIFAMFLISLNADQPNILNYEREITNRYAAWEQELTEREQVIREKERQWNNAQ